MRDDEDGDATDTSYVLPNWAYRDSMAERGGKNLQSRAIGVTNYALGVHSGRSRPQAGRRMQQPATKNEEGRAGTTGDIFNDLVTEEAKKAKEEASRHEDTPALLGDELLWPVPAAGDRGGRLGRRRRETEKKKEDGEAELTLTSEVNTSVSQLVVLLQMEIATEPAQENQPKTSN